MHGVDLITNARGVSDTLGPRPSAEAHQSPLAPFIGPCFSGLGRVAAVGHRRSARPAVLVARGHDERVHFREFLQRCRDKDVNVREAVVSAAATIMQHKPDCAEECAGTSFGEERRLCSFAECILRIFFWPELTVCMILAHGWLCCCSGVEDAGRRP